MEPVLGAIVAGGASRRFGSDKAEALWRGQTLLDHAVAALRPHAAALATLGRDHPGCDRLDDRPAGSGPIGGLASAIHAAASRGFVGVLCVPLDVHPLPCDLDRLLVGREPTVFAGQHMIGWWPAQLCAPLDAFIAAGGRAVRAWIAQSGARLVPDPPGMVNVNTPADLARLPG
jgi:molybdopterin-guanine dinucleotide biosynthesis protein A